MLKRFSLKWNPGEWRLRMNVSVFSICLLIAIFLWVVIKMSDTYSATISCDLEHTTTGKNWIITQYSHQQVHIDVDAKGFSLINRLWLRSRPALTIDPEKINLIPAPLNPDYNYYMLTRELTDKLEQDVHFPGQMTGIFPDTLFFLLDQKESKKVAVETVTQIHFAPQYHYYEDILVHPDSVTIYGAKNQLDTMERVRTKPFTRSGLKQNLNIMLALNLPKGIKSNRDSVQLRMQVEEFTEKSVTVPVDTRSFQKEGYILRTFPQEVTITCWVALKDYERVSSAQFAAAVKKESLNMETDDNVRVIVSRFPTYVKHIRVSPREVEYVIKKDENQ